MHADGHALRTVLDRRIEKLGVGLRQRGWVLTNIGDLFAQLRITEVGEVDLVDLQIAAAGLAEITDFLAVQAGEIFVERGDVGISISIDRSAPAAEMHHGW
jgi:hypothetical protein